MQENNNQTLWQIIKRYFNVLPYKDGEKYVIKQITNGINFQGSNLWILIFAVFIASLGLNVNSTAVIIGAMLISPLMGPIIGMGLALGIADLDLFKQSIKNYLVSTFISVITATIYFTLSPITDAQSELLARTSPTLYDVLIALFWWCCWILSYVNKRKKQRGARCCHCHSLNATTLYSRLWTGRTKHILLLWGILPLFHQYCFHCFYNLSWCTLSAFS